MPPLTLEAIALLITGIAAPLLAGALAFWKMIQAKITESLAGVRKEFADLKAAHDKSEGLIAALERESVTKEDHLASMTTINNSISALAIALRETGATLTHRIDLVLFEVGRKSKDG